MNDGPQDLAPAGSRGLAVLFWVGLATLGAPIGAQAWTHLAETGIRQARCVDVLLLGAVEAFVVVSGAAAPHVSRALVALRSE